MAKERKPTSSLLKDLQAGVYTMTDQLALIYAKLLTVGCPPIRAVIYCCPDIELELAKKVSRVWLNDAGVLRALESINGGTWHELPPETRYKLALDKHKSELAFYLWTTNFNDIEHREGIEKLKQAREEMKKLNGEAVDDDPLAAFARFTLELAQNATKTPVRPGKKAPQLEAKDDLADLVSKMTSH